MDRGADKTRKEKCQEMIFFFFEILQHNFSRQRDLSTPKNFVPKFLPTARGLYKFLWTVCYCVVVKIKRKKFNGGVC